MTAGRHIMHNRLRRLVQANLMGCSNNTGSNWLHCRYIYQERTAHTYTDGAMAQATPSHRTLAAQLSKSCPGLSQHISTTYVPILRFSKRPKPSTHRNAPANCQKHKQRGCHHHRPRHNALHAGWGVGFKQGHDGVEVLPAATTAAWGQEKGTPAPKVMTVLSLTIHAELTVGGEPLIAAVMQCSAAPCCAEGWRAVV